MILPFLSLCSDESEDRSRGTPPQCGSEEIVDSPVVASPSSRASLFGSAGKEATVAPGGVVLNAA
jgi:hypothetical protein